MSALVKSVRHVQIKKIAFTPDLYTALITYESYYHPCEYDESDDIEHQKNLINKLISQNWFVNNGKNIPDGSEYF
jgi:hypothetical protein